MGVPNRSGERSSEPHASHSMAKTELNRAAQLGQRCRISPPQVGQVAGSSAADSSK
jgi:hypothetical protein